tara:strand:+ start:379179 stop:379505 length:327 start_codon:yes stop_codon:yes gene_type:complete
MGKIHKESFSLNLASSGDFYDFPVLGDDSFSAQGIGVPEWGSAIVELKKVIGGEAVSFSTAKELKVSGSNFRHEDVTTETSESIRAVVTTADATKLFGRIIMIGEGKD